LAPVGGDARKKKKKKKTHFAPVGSEARRL